MKKFNKIQFSLLLGLILFSCSNSPNLQNTNKARPEKIDGIAKENKSIAYYEEQSKLWQALIKEDPKNAEAWNYYYKAERAKLQLENPNLWTQNKESFYEKLAPFLLKSKKHIGNKFEYFYLKGLNSTGQNSINALKKAYAIDSERSEVYGPLLNYYVPLFNEKECKDLAKRMLNSNIYSDANLKWNYNSLQSVEKNGVIISNGDMDGIPKWVLQYGAEIRQDVIATNKWFLAFDKEYLKKIYNKIDINIPEKNEEDFENIALYADYLAADILKRSKRPAYISAGTPDQFFKDHGLEDKMYLVGNVLKYSEKSFDNTALLIENFEEKYYLEDIFKNFQKHHEDEIVKTQLNFAYLPGLTQLKKHYKSTQDEIKYKYYNNIIQRIAEASGQKEAILQAFD